MRGGGNMQGMMKQMQKMQKQMAEAQEELGTLKFEGTAGDKSMPLEKKTFIIIEALLID